MSFVMKTCSKYSGQNKLRPMPFFFISNIMLRCLFQKYLTQLKTITQIKLDDTISGAIKQSFDWKYRLYFMHEFNFPRVPVFLPI